MEYIGIDPVVGLECGDCKHISRLQYSRLLNLILTDEEVLCESCDRIMEHDWTTVSVVQNIIRRRMRQANQAKEMEAARG